MVSRTEVAARDHDSCARTRVVNNLLEVLLGGADDVVACKQCHLATGPSASPCCELGRGGSKPDGGQWRVVEVIGIQLGLGRIVGGAVEQQQLVATSAKDAPQSTGSGCLKCVVGRPAGASVEAELA